MRKRQARDRPGDADHRLGEKRGNVVQVRGDSRRDVARRGPKRPGAYGHTRRRHQDEVREEATRRDRAEEMCRDP